MVLGKPTQASGLSRTVIWGMVGGGGEGLKLGVRLGVDGVESGVRGLRRE